MSEIIQHEIVLVQDRSKKIVGIVTTTDLSEQLRDLTEAFLLIGNIERQIRRLMGNRFDRDVLRSFVPRVSSRVVKGVEDLNSGQYLASSGTGTLVTAGPEGRLHSRAETPRASAHDSKRSDAFSCRFHQRNRSRQPAIDRGVLGISLTRLTHVGAGRFTLSPPVPPLDRAPCLPDDLDINGEAAFDVQIENPVVGVSEVSERCHCVGKGLREQPAAAD